MFSLISPPVLVSLLSTPPSNELEKLSSGWVTVLSSQVFKNGGLQFKRRRLLSDWGGQGEREGGFAHYNDGTDWLSEGLPKLKQAKRLFGDYNLAFRFVRRWRWNTLLPVYTLSLSLIHTNYLSLSLRITLLMFFELQPLFCTWQSPRMIPEKKYLQRDSTIFSASS